MFDVVIRGGGPAGAVTGLCLARQGASVAIAEATSYDTDRFGETLSPEVNPVLHELGLWDDFRALVPLESPGAVSAWGRAEPSEQDFISSPFGTGWRVDRNAFDVMLARAAAAAGAEVSVNCRAEPVWTDDAWTVGPLRGRFLIDAGGRNGPDVNGELDLDADDLLLAITMLVSYPRGSPADCRTSVETTPSGWWYTGLLPNGHVMAMFFTDSETYTGDGVSVAEQLAAAPLTRGRLDGGRIARSRVVSAPSACRKTLVGAHWLAVGDRASCYDPLSGRGIFKALRHGAAAARALALHVGGNTAALEDYARMVRREFDDYVRQRRLHYAGERRWPDAGFWRRRNARP